MANKYAVLAGCNYPNTRNELHGCVNDVTRMRRVLVRRFGFPHTNITFMIDTDSAYTKPTGQNIRQALADMVDKTKPGDVLFLHYSGHGTFMPAKKPHRRRGHTYDECIVPCDFNLLTDEDFRGIVNRVPKGATFTMMCDSCNSGGLIDKEKEQIGPHVPPAVTKKRRRSEPTRSRSKFISVESLVETLKDKTGNPELHVGDIRVALFHLFGNDASCNVKSHVKYLLEKNGSDAAAMQLLMNKAKKDAWSVSNQKSLAVDDKKERVDGDMGILLSGCQSNETSADANPSGQEKGAYGAFSNAVERVLATHRKPISNRELVLRSRKLLDEAGYSQHPCLYCSDVNAEVAFLCQE